MAQLFANPDFMRFSLGVFTERKTDCRFHRESDGLGSRRYAVAVCRCLAWRTRCHWLLRFSPSSLKCRERSRSRYRLHPDYWNRGLITEAARAVRDHGFADLKLPRVISLIHPENIPSRRVAEKNGMKVEKEITFRGFPTLVYAITREQWLANRDAS